MRPGGLGTGSTTSRGTAEAVPVTEASKSEYALSSLIKETGRDLAYLLVGEDDQVALCPLDSLDRQLPALALSCEDVRAVDKAEWQVFGEWVESLRKRSGLQVKELAERAGVSAQWLQELRYGGRAIYGEWRLPNPKDDALARLARALNVPVEEMFARAGRDAAPGDAEADTGESAAADRGNARTLKRIRELETRITQYEKELSELRELVQGQQPKRAESH